MLCNALSEPLLNVRGDGAHLAPRGLDAQVCGLFVKRPSGDHHALEHGVLGLSSSLKQGAEGFERYVEARQQSLQNLQKGQITFSLSYRTEQGQGVIRIDMQDSGAGFNYRALSDDALAPSKRLSGRGIALIRRFCRHVEYRGAGNKVYAELVC